MSTTPTILQRVKVALRVAGNSFDDEIQCLIDSCKAELTDAKITVDETDARTIRTIIAYCKAYFGEPENPELKMAIYRENRDQLNTCTGYTDWGDENG